MDMFEVYPFNLALEVLGNKQLVLGMSTKYFLKAVHGLLGVEKTVVVGLYKEEKTLEKIAEENRIRNIEEVKERAVQHLKELEDSYKAIPLSMARGGVPVVGSEGDEEYQKLKKAYDKLHYEYEILLRKKEDLGELKGTVKVSEADLSVRAINVLERHGMSLLSDIGKRSVRELRELRGMGAATLNEILMLAKSHGIMISEV